MTTFVESSINGAWLINPVRHKDARGWFQELFKHSAVLNSTGIDFQPTQINLSESTQGVVRGVHYSLAEQGQAKYVTVMDGEIDDYIVDVRIESPTYGKWERIKLNATEGKSVLLASNLGHAFQVISERATVCYAVTSEFNPAMEKAVNPLCNSLNIKWSSNFAPLISDKDSEAADLIRCRQALMLPK